MSSTANERPSVILLEREEARRQLDQKSRSVAGIPGDEFIRCWEAGEYDRLAETAPVLFRQLKDLAALIAFGR